MTTFTITSETLRLEDIELTRMHILDTRDFTGLTQTHTNVWSVEVDETTLSDEELFDLRFEMGHLVDLINEEGGEVTLFEIIK